MDAQRRQHRLDRLSIEAQREIAEGSPDKCADICRTLIREWSEIQGPEGDKVLLWRGFLGRALTEAQRYREAEEVLSDLLIDRERIIGPDNPSTLTTRGNLARAIALGGRPDEAIFHARCLLADRMRVLGPDHSSTFDAVGHLAHFHLLDEQFDVAAEIYDELLTRRTIVLGEDHPDVLQTYHNLVVSRANAGSHDDVAELRSLAEMLQDDFGFDHSDTLNVYALLADSLIRHEQFDEALHMAQSVLDTRSRTAGDLDPRTLSSRAVVAKALLRLGRWSEAMHETLRIVELHAEHGRDDEVAGVQSVVHLLDWWTNGFGLLDVTLDRQSLEDLLGLTHWLEAKAARLELSVEYRDLAARARNELEKHRSN